MKFLLPRIINEPVGRNSPVGADFDTWSGYTHHAPDIILVYHAFDRHTVKMAASYNVATGVGISLRCLLMTVDAAPP
jgi:hypothetical protein